MLYRDLTSLCNTEMDHDTIWHILSITNDVSIVWGHGKGHSEERSPWVHFLKRKNSSANCQKAGQLRLGELRLRINCSSSLTKSSPNSSNKTNQFFMEFQKFGNFPVGVQSFLVWFCTRSFRFKKPLPLMLRRRYERSLRACEFITI